MPRVLKPQEIETVKHKDMEVIIYLNRNDVVFFAEFASEKFEDPAIEPVRKWVRQTIDRTSSFDWKPTIELNINHPNESGRVSISISRYYTALRWDGVPVTAGWDYSIFGKEERRVLTDEEKNKAAQTLWWEEKGVPFELPCVRNRSRGSLPDTQFYFPYTEVLWENLNGMVSRVNSVRETMHETLHALFNEMRNG